jgi:hypothetical protein
LVGFTGAKERKQLTIVEGSVRVLWLTKVLIAVVVVSRVLRMVSGGGVVAEIWV